MLRGMTAQFRALLLCVATVAAVVPSTAAHAAAPPQYKNCTAFNAPKYFPHGLGEAKAVDKVTGSLKPVTTFRRDTAGYRKAMDHNRSLDRDGDRIACEKK